MNWPGINILFYIRLPVTISFIDLFSSGMQELTEQEFLDKLAEIKGRVVGRTTIVGLDFAMYEPFAGKLL